MNTELLIEETNKLRLKLGLKPIPVSDKPEEPISEPPAKPSPNKKEIPSTILNEDLNQGSLVEGEVMVLKDTSILDEDQDELITETELLDKHLQRNEEAREGEYFKVGDGRVRLKLNEKARNEAEAKEMEETAKKNNKRLVSFDEEDQDYMLQNEFGKIKSKDFLGKFKKVKKKKKNPVKLLKEEDIESTQSVEKEDLDGIFDGEDELQAIMDAQRAKVNKERAKEGARRDTKGDFRLVNPKNPLQLEDLGLVIDTQNDFLNSVKRSLLDKSGEGESSAESIAGRNLAKESLSRSPNRDPKQILSSTSTPEPEPTSKLLEPESTTEPLEPNFNSTGLSSTLAFLQKASVINLTKEAIDKEKDLLKQQRLIAKVKAKQALNEDVTRDLKDYNPQVNIVYTDDQNNVLDTKEAYKHLSHKFHGVKPSKQKQAKIMARRAKQG